MTQKIKCFKTHNNKIQKKVSISTVDFLIGKIKFHPSLFSTTDSCKYPKREGFYEYHRNYVPMQKILQNL